MNTGEDEKPDLEPAEYAETPAPESIPDEGIAGPEAPESASPEEPAEQAEDPILNRLDEGFDSLQDAVTGLAKQLSLLPAQGRRLAGKVEDLTTSVSDSRLRPLFDGVIVILDMAERARAIVSAEGGDPRLWDGIAVQIRQLLLSNGLTEIPTDGVFDARVHRAMDRAPVDDPALDGTIIETLRPGYRTDHVVLRSAEVRLGRYQAPEPVVVDSEPGVAEAPLPVPESDQDAEPSPADGVEPASAPEEETTPNDDSDRPQTGGSSDV